MLKVISRRREVVNGQEYNVTYMRDDENGNQSTVYDPVRTPEQKAKRDARIKEAIAVFGRQMLDKYGKEWFLEHMQVDPGAGIPEGWETDRG